MSNFGTSQWLKSFKQQQFLVFNVRNKHYSSGIFDIYQHNPNCDHKACESSVNSSFPRSDIRGSVHCFYDLTLPLCYPQEPLAGSVQSRF